MIPSSFDQCLFTAIAVAIDYVQTSSSKHNHLAFPVFAVGSFTIALCVAFRNLLHHTHDIFAGLDLGQELAIVTLEELQESPDGNVLKGRITTGKESCKIAVDAARWVGPVL